MSVAKFECRNCSVRHSSRSSPPPWPCGEEAPVMSRRLARVKKMICRDAIFLISSFVGCRDGVYQVNDDAFAEVIN